MSNVSWSQVKVVVRKSSQGCKVSHGHKRATRESCANLTTRSWKLLKNESFLARQEEFLATKRWSFQNYSTRENKCISYGSTDVPLPAAQCTQIRAAFFLLAHLKVSVCARNVLPEGTGSWYSPKRYPGVNFGPWLKWWQQSTLYSFLTFFANYILARTWNPSIP